MRLVLAAAGLLLGAPAAAEPLELFNGRLFVEATLNGEPVRALLDSGAEMTVLDDDYAAARGLAAEHADNLAQHAFELDQGLLSSLDFGRERTAEQGNQRQRDRAGDPVRPRRSLVRHLSARRLRARRPADRARDLVAGQLRHATDALPGTGRAHPGRRRRGHPQILTAAPAHHDTPADPARYDVDHPPQARSRKESCRKDLRQWKSARPPRSDRGPPAGEFAAQRRGPRG